MEFDDTEDAVVDQHNNKDEASQTASSRTPHGIRSGRAAPEADSVLCLCVLPTGPGSARF